jgi:hypothetical protein
MEDDFILFSLCEGLKVESLTGKGDRFGLCVGCIHPVATIGSGWLCGCARALLRTSPKNGSANGDQLFESWSPVLMPQPVF